MDGGGSGCGGEGRSPSVGGVAVGGSVMVVGGVVVVSVALVVGGVAVVVGVVGACLA